MKASAVSGVAALGLLLSGVSALAQPGPTFDCSKAEHEVEALICKDDELVAKDRKLAVVYSQAIAAMEKIDTGGQEAIRELRTTQRGWIGGRNDCWKAADKRQCTIDSYDRRTAFLQARYFLLEGSTPVYFSCSDNSQIVATFIPTDPLSVRLERGDNLEVGVLSRTGSGSRYDADFGIYFWTKGEEAKVAWPQENEFDCAVSK